VIERLKRKTADQGFPYQALISSLLFRFGFDQLKDEDAVRKAGQR